MKSVILTTRKWKKIREELYTEYPKTVFMIRSKMKSVLGFTVREHQEWNNGEHSMRIHLDFFSANKRTMFMLKFSEIIGADDGKL
jgi:hypothetical protein